ncbi:hypothetical protein ACIRSU_01380 [Streptomyces sp. NPDC101160]|uniref:hypothetical protein n=1 Tax=Streptomyces sp. NPDC101160 TaxID=3366118 RepID=UPI00380F4DD1
MRSVQVRNAKGDVLRRLAADPKFDPVLFGVDLHVYPLLASIDPYGDTVFNYLQVRRLLNELATYRPTQPPSEEFLGDLRELCDVALSGPHRFLWFIGD